MPGDVPTTRRTKSGSMQSVGDNMHQENKNQRLNLYRLLSSFLTKKVQSTADPISRPRPQHKMLRAQSPLLPRHNRSENRAKWTDGRMAVPAILNLINNSLTVAVGFSFLTDCHGHGEGYLINPCIKSSVVMV
jgi:hypothetical protein